MAYQGYSDQPAQQRYGGPSPYGQAGNPYDEDTSYGGGGNNPYASGQYDARPGQNNYEMSNMNSSDPNRILNACRDIDNEVDQLDARLQRLKQMQAVAVNSTDSSANRQLESESENLLQAYRNLVQHTKRIKQDKDSGNPRNAPQVGRVDRKVKASLNNLQKADSDYRKKLQEQIERDYRIVRPDASDAEIRDATQNAQSGQVFSQALINSDRRGEAQSVASSVRARHAAIQKIEQDMMQLAELFQDLDALVVQQEAQVTQIDQRGEEVREDVTKANVELDGAVTKARAARKKKWICLGIAAAVIVVIIIIIVIIVSIQNAKKNNNNANTAARLLMTL